MIKHNYCVVFGGSKVNGLFNNVSFTFREVGGAYDGKQRQIYFHKKTLL